VQDHPNPTGLASASNAPAIVTGPGGPVNPAYKDKYLQVHFTIEDEGAFTTPWTATIIYLRDRLE
jgi:hypothetical protein